MSTLKTSVVAGLVAGLLATCDGHAADRPVEETRIALDQTVISGSQELPKVLYILPWQTPGGRPDLPATTAIVDDGLWRRVEPPTHRREVLYLERLQGNAQKE